MPTKQTNCCTNIYCHYKTLNLPHNANSKEIKKAYNALALVYHPDQHIDKSAEEKENLRIKFNQLVVSYKELMNNNSDIFIGLELGPDIDKYMLNEKENPRERAIQLLEIVKNAQQKYAAWYKNNNQENRGFLNGWFTKIRHGTYGQKLVEDLVIDLTAKLQKGDIFNFLHTLKHFSMNKLNLHNHSFGSYLLDEFQSVVWQWSKSNFHKKQHGSDIQMLFCSYINPVAPRNATRITCARM